MRFVIFTGMIRKLMKTRREMVKDTREPEKATCSHIGSMV